MSIPELPTGLEEKITSLISQLAITNQTLLVLAQQVQQHQSLFYGTSADGGLITERNVTRQILKEHEASLNRLEDDCNRITGFMDRQVEINKAQSDSLHLMNRVIIMIAGTVFVLLLLIGAADLHALQNLLSHIAVP